ncbi:MAG TPA: hypothetical protein VLB79_04375 [Solirubrobacterales bacterium]|nr:hypothetical protein [Solirubrobacterales bacterium]
MNGGVATARVAAAFALAAAVLALRAPGARAGCGGVETASPKHKVAPRPPLAIGDSSMLLALPALSRIGYKVNARGCRQFTEGLSVLRDARRHHRLPHLAVLALGADASISAGQIAQARKIMGPKRKLGLVTPRELGGGESKDADVIRGAGRRDPVHVKVLDWVHYSAGHSSWFQPDGLHLTFSGAKAFARLLKKLIPLASPGPKRPKRPKKP